MKKENVNVAIMQDRLNKIMIDLSFKQKKTITIRDFAELIGRNESSMSSALSGNPRYATYGLLKQINRKLPEYSMSWLLGNSEINNNNAIVIANPKSVEIPLINADQRGDYFNSYYAPNFLNSVLMINYITNEEGSFQGFEVVDDDMHPEYNNRDIVIGKEVKRFEWSTGIDHTNFDFVICHSTEGIIICEILKHDIKSGTLTCIKLSGKQFHLNLRDVTFLYRIVEHRTKNRRRKI